MTDQAILTDAHIHRKSQLIADAILDGMRQCDCVRIDPMGAAKIQIALI